LNRENPHIAVVAAVIVADGRVLCVRKGVGRYSYTSNKYEFPGGKIETGETKEQALTREISEELNIRIDILRHLITVNHHYPDFSITLYSYICTIAEGEIVLNEHKEHKWLLPKDLSSVIWAEADRDIVSTLSEIEHTNLI